MNAIKEQLLNREQLIQKAAEFLGLKIDGNTSESLGQYNLQNNGFLGALKAHGFIYEQRKDGIATLAGKEPPAQGGVIDCWYWNFRTRENEKNEQVLTLKLVPFLSERDRGVVFRPYAKGTFGSALDTLANFKVFETIAEYDQKAHPLVREIVTKQGKITVYWTDIGLGGIRSIRTLFKEFRNNNAEMDRLCRSYLSPFDPNPYPCQNTFVIDIFLPEPFQPALFQLWQQQLQSFQKSLAR